MAALSQQHHPDRREHDPPDVPEVPRSSHRYSQRAEEFDGDGDPERDACERLVNRKIHNPK